MYLETIFQHYYRKEAHISMSLINRKRAISGIILSVVVALYGTSLTSYATENAGLQSSVTKDTEDSEEEEVVQNNTVTVNGKTIKSTLDGNYFAYSIPGLAVVSPMSELQKQADFMVLEYFFVSTWDLYKYTAPLAVQAMNIVAQSQGAELGATFQMTVSRLFSKKVYAYENPDLQVSTKIQIPTAFAGSKNTYAMVFVKAGGTYEILPDLDDDPATITFNAHAGSGAYGIMKY